MRRFLLKIILLQLFCLLPYDQATATLTEQDIAVTPQGIHIQLHERALGKVLRHIQHASGIRFSFPRAMRTTTITAAIHAPDWPAAVRELLRPFNTVQVWDKNGLSQVFILERGTAVGVSKEPTGVLESRGEKAEEVGSPEVPPTVSLPSPPPLPPPPPPPPLSP